MTTAAQDRRRALRERLIDIAEAQIAAEGLASLRARDLARLAGCSVGAIYNAVGDLNELALEVNARTFARLGAHVTAATPDDLPPADRLIAMAQAYHAFAAAHHNALARPVRYRARSRRGRTGLVSRRNETSLCPDRRTARFSAPRPRRGGPRAPDAGAVLCGARHRAAVARPRQRRYPCGRDRPDDRAHPPEPRPDR